MADEKKHVFVIVDDRFILSAGRDVVSMGLLLAAVGVGVLIGSNALQWIAGLLWIFVVLGRAVNRLNSPYKTIAAARKRLDEIEAGTAD